MSVFVKLEACCSSTLVSHFNISFKYHYTYTFHRCNGNNGTVFAAWRVIEHFWRLKIGSARQSAVKNGIGIIENISRYFPEVRSKHYMYAVLPFRASSFRADTCSESLHVALFRNRQLHTRKARERSAKTEIAEIYIPDSRHIRAYEGTEN